MAGEAKVLTVAAVQMVSENGNVEGNLEHATAFVEEAAEKGASLVVLPEFMPNGYIYDSGMMWDTAEREGGPTSTWMKETSSRLGIWLGAGFLEAEGEDFFLSFLVTAPDGGEAGRVRKQTPAFGGNHMHVINLGSDQVFAYVRGRLSRDGGTPNAARIASLKRRTLE